MIVEGVVEAADDFGRDLGKMSPGPAERISEA